MADWRFRCELVFGSQITLRGTLRDAYEALSGSPAPDHAIEESSEPRGFMIGAGRTSTYAIAIGEDVHIRTEDWWEDNIAGPTEYPFVIHARSQAALDRAVEAVLASANKQHAPLLERR